MRFATRRQPQRRPCGRSTHATRPGAPIRTGSSRGRQPVRAEAATLSTVAVTAGTAISTATGGTVAPVPLDTFATDTAADTPGGEAETLAVTVTGTGARESLPYRHEPWRSIRRRRPLRPASPIIRTRVARPPFPGPPPFPSSSAPLGPWVVGGGESSVGGDAPVTPGAGTRGHARRDHAAAREPRLLVSRRALWEATLIPPRLAGALLAGARLRSGSPLRRGRRSGSAARKAARANCHLRARESATRLPARPVMAARRLRSRPSGVERATRQRQRALIDLAP